MKRLVLVSSFIVACGSSAAPAPAPDNTPPPPDPNANSTPGDDTSQPQATDPHDIYPASHPPIPQIYYFGGRVLKAPELVTVTFAGMDPSLRDVVRNFDDNILTTSWWKIAMDGYGVGPGAGAGYAELPDTLSGKTTSDDDLKTYLGTQITSGKLPMPTDQTVYMLYMPTTAIIDLDGAQSCSGFGGYHNSADVTLSGQTKHFLYTVNAECYANYPGVSNADVQDEFTETGSHEIAETATDPDIGAPNLKAGYYLTDNDAWAPNQRGGEIGDLCEGQSYKEGNWFVTQVWNAAAAKASHAPCEPAPNPVYYGAVPHTEVPATKIGGSPGAGGYIVVNKGETRNVEVDVFSTDKLANDLTIVAGKSSRGYGGGGSTFDPTKVSQVGKGITMSLSLPGQGTPAPQATARNGDKVTLSISVDNTAISSSSRFTVRAILSRTDYHSWPVILYVP
jgi:hypothetical protein